VAARAVDALRHPGEMIVAEKAVGWYTQSRQFIDQESWQHVVWDVEGPQTFDGTYLGIPTRLIVLDISEASLYRAYDGLLLPHGYVHVAQYGTFMIYAKP
jgi:hypothetical protein